MHCFRDSWAERGRNMSEPNNLPLASAGTSCLGGKCLKHYNYGIMYSKRVSWLSFPELESLYSLPDPCEMLLNLVVPVTCSSVVTGEGTIPQQQLAGALVWEGGEKNPNFSGICFEFASVTCLWQRNHIFENIWRGSSFHSHI